MPVNEEKTMEGMKAYDNYDVWARKHVGGSDKFKDLWNKAHGIRKRGRPRQEDTPSADAGGDES